MDGEGASGLVEKSSFRYLLKAIRHKSESRTRSVFRDSESNGPRGLPHGHSRRNNFRDVYVKCSDNETGLFLRINPQERKNNTRNLGATETMLAGTCHRFFTHRTFIDVHFQLRILTRIFRQLVTTVFPFRCSQQFSMQHFRNMTN